MMKHKVSIGVFSETVALRETIHHKNYKHNKTFFSITRIDTNNIYYHNGFKDIITQKELPDFDYYWINGTTDDSLLGGLITHYLHIKKKRHVDPLKFNMISKDKLYQQITLETIGAKVPETLAFRLSLTRKKQIANIIEKALHFPIIAKDPKGARGTGVFLLKDPLELFDFIQKNLWKTVLFQQFIKNAWDVRVIVVGEKIEWVLHRYNKNCFKHNLSSGAVASEITLPDAVQKECIQLSKKLWLDVSWVDLILHGQEAIYIEFNDMPDSRPFEKNLGYDFDIKLIEYLYNKDI